MTEAITKILEACKATDARTEVLESPPGVDVIVAVSMPEERSFDRWEEMNTCAQERGYVALGVGSDHQLSGLREHLGFGDAAPFDALLAEANALDIAVWFAEREKELVSEEFALPVGEWAEPDGPPQSGLWFPFDDDGEHLDPWWLVLVPATERWMAPLSLAYGSWNDCPDPHVHAAMCKHWAETHGARLVASGPDTLEFLVETPPVDRASAMSLAREQYFYCGDIVDQGTETIAALAANLMGNGVWSFWWD